MIGKKGLCDMKKMQKGRGGLAKVMQERQYNST